MPLNRYIDCVVNETTAGLLIDGEPTAEEWAQIAQSWADIEAEYADAMGNAEYKNYVQQLRAIAILKTNLRLIQMAIVSLSDMIDKTGEPVDTYRAAFTKELNDMLGSTFTFDPKDDVKYIAELSRADMRSRGLKIELDLRLQRFEALSQKYDKAAKPDAFYFRSVLITLSDAAGYHIRDDITVFEFCERVRRLEKKAAEIKK